MAFNPFNWFRKNQKVIFAALTIMCMIVFVFQFGGGDPLTRALHWFGGGRAQGATVQTLNGRRVTEGDLARLANHRRVANDFLAYVIGKSQQPMTESLLNDKLKVREGKDNPLIGARAVVDSVAKNQSFLEFIRSGRFPMPPEQLRMSINRMATQAIEQFETLTEIARREGVAESPENLKVLQQVGALVGMQLWALTRTPNDELFMGGNRQTESLLDFVLWQQQADRLGITLTDADVAREIMVEAAGNDLFDPEKKSLASEKEVTDFMTALRFGKRGSGPGGINTPAELIEAVRQEIRVAMAQGLLLGMEPGGRQWRSLLKGKVSPAVGTPDEFFRFYREHCTTLRVRMLPVDVERFLPEVANQAPSDTELRKLFDRYREQEPEPASRTPGFKEPRRVRAEYVVGTVTDAYYRDYAKLRAGYLAEMAQPWRRAKACILGPALLPVGAGPIGWALAAGCTVALDPVQSEYQSYLKTTDAWVPEDRGTWDKAQLSGLLRPHTIAQVLCSHITAGAASNPFAPTGTYLLHGLAHDVRGSINYTKARIAASASAHDLGGLLSVVAQTIPLAPAAVPLKTLEPTILASLEEKLARSHLRSNIAGMQEEVEKFKGKPDAGNEVLPKKAKELHLAYHRMSRALSLPALAEAVKKPKNDLDLTAFHKAFTGMDAMRRGEEVKIEQLVGFFYGESGTYTITRQSRLDGEKEEVLFWRSEDRKAELRDFAAAREDVLAAWRQEKARELARNKALELQKAVNDAKGTPTDAVRILREAKLGEPFEMENVAQALAPEKEVRPGVKTEYRPYMVPASLDAVLPYPPPDLAKLLLEQLKRAGDATVVVDRPARHFYVAVLEARDEKTIGDFKALYGRTPSNDTLFDIFVAQKRAEYRRAVITQLRKEANAKLTSDRYDVPDSVAKGFAGRSDGDE